MVERIIHFPDVEQRAVAAVNELLPAMGLAELDFEVRAATTVPNPRPRTFVRIMRAGGVAETVVSENALLTLEGWDDDDEGRAVWAINRARGILKAQDEDLFGYSEVGGLANLPDPTTSQIRYTMMVGIRARGVPVT
jgi:hypothetical protein